MVKQKRVSGLEKKIVYGKNLIFPSEMIMFQSILSAKVKNFEITDTVSFRPVLMNCSETGAQTKTMPSSLESADTKSLRRITGVTLKAELPTNQLLK